MDDLIEDTAPSPDNAPEFSVSEISGALKRTIETSFSHVRVRGEIGRLSRPRSGHLYLDLKDDRSVLSAVIWKGVAARLTHPPEEGMEVVATGRLTTFVGQSKYQLIIDDLRPAGMGALMAMLEKRRAMLAAEGLFDAAGKKPLPFLPDVIGVVTSPSGAVIRDILHRLRDRFPRQVLIWPVAVQGDRAAPEVTNAIRGFNALPHNGAIPRPDLLIVARGGGSVEDLWAFNEENVVRAAAESVIPLISAVGHETDTTLIDFAADWRAPTPTAAAERAVPVRLDLLNTIRGQETILHRGIMQTLTARRQRMTDLGRALPRPERLLDTARQRLDLAALSLTPALRRISQDGRQRLGRAAGRLHPALDHMMSRNRLIFAQNTARLIPSVLHGMIRRGRDDLGKLERRLDTARLAQRVTNAHHHIKTLTKRFIHTAQGVLKTQTVRLDTLARLHQSLGYKETLRRGYAVVWIGETVLTRKKAVADHTTLNIEFVDGRLAVAPIDAPPKPQTRKRRTPSGSGPQGSLF